MGIHDSFLQLMHMNCVRNILIVSLLAAVSLTAAPAKVSFNREVRAILAENCFQCHGPDARSEEHTSELQSRTNLVCRLLLEKKKTYLPSLFHLIYLPLLPHPQPYQPN